MTPNLRNFYSKQLPKIIQKATIRDLRRRFVQSMSAFRVVNWSGINEHRPKTQYVGPPI